VADPDEDFGASTARFQAFVQQQDGDQPPAWKMRASGARIALLVGIVVGVAAVAALIGLALAG
jgi:hypothetical protein